MSLRKPKWRYTAGDRGAQVTVYERLPGGPLYVRATNGRGGYIRQSLGYRDRDRAKAYALAEAAKLQAGEGAVRDGRLPIARLFALYLAHHTPNKTANEQAADRRRVGLWTKFLGAGKDCRKITREEWARFSRERAAGELAADGTCPSTARPVGARAVQQDLQWLKWVLGWATTWQDPEGNYLLAANPVRGKQAFPIPSEKNPKRPVASTDRLEAVLAAANQLMMELRWGGKAIRQRAYLADILTLLSETGRRVSAVLTLQWGDLLWESGPYGSIRWRSDSDKMDREWVAPLSPKARAALDRLRLERPGIGSAYIFPNPTKPDQPVSRRRASHWLRKAEMLAGLETQDGSLFHAYRRAWATARKHLPVKDVAAAGGWKSTAVLLNHYQQPDDATLLRVVTGGLELREVK